MLKKTIPKLIIQIVTWNSQKFLKDCLNSIFKQTFKSFSVLIIDNGSIDDTVKFIQENYSKQQIKQKFERSNRLFIFQNNKNMGFSRAHNQGFTLSQSEFALVMNPDIILEPDFLNKIMRTAVKEKKAGSFGPKLLQIKTGDTEYNEKIKTEIIDTTGFRILKTRHIVDRGQGQKDKWQYDKLINVFGISGACVLYRRQALEDVKIPKIDTARFRPQGLRTTAGTQFSNQIKGLKKIGEYFDQDFFAYQEDMDLAWRLQLRNWPAVYVPKARAYHFRAIGIKEKGSLFEIARKHWHRPGIIECLCFRNHLWLLLKNSYSGNFLRHFFLIFFYQLGKEIYLLFTKPKVLFKASFLFWRKFRKMYKKRRFIMKNAKVDAQQMRKFMEKSRLYH